MAFHKYTGYKKGLPYLRFYYNFHLPYKMVHLSVLSAVLYTVKKAFRYSRPQPGCHLPNSPWAGIIELFPPMSFLSFAILGRPSTLLIIQFSKKTLRPF
jgi:hypothetical protein